MCCTLQILPWMFERVLSCMQTRCYTTSAVDSRAKPLLSSLFCFWPRTWIYSLLANTWSGGVCLGLLLHCIVCFSCCLWQVLLKNRIRRCMMKWGYNAKAGLTLLFGSRRWSRDIKGCWISKGREWLFFNYILAMLISFQIAGLPQWQRIPTIRYEIWWYLIYI